MFFLLTTAVNLTEASLNSVSEFGTDYEEEEKEKRVIIIKLRRGRRHSLSVIGRCTYYECLTKLWCGVGG